MDSLLRLLEIVSDWAIPVLVLVIPLVGIFRKVKVYETFVEGAKEGFEVGVKIMPFLVAILVAIGMLRDVKAMGLFVAAMEPLTNLIGMPAELLPLAIMRPLSGSGSAGLMVDLMKQYGADSYLGLMASAMYGSSETTFYIIAVYFGAANVTKTRHAVAAGLLGDAAGALASVWICRVLFSNLIPA